MQKGVNENEFFYFTGDFGLIKEKVTEITDRIIRRTVGTTLADFFAVSVCPVSFGLYRFNTDSQGLGRFLVIHPLEIAQLEYFTAFPG